MLTEIIAPILVFLSVQTPISKEIATTPLASKEITLTTDKGISFIGDAKKHNILLALNYLSDRAINVGEPFYFKFELPSKKTFAFHDDVLPEYKDKVFRTTKAHFNFQEGFRSDGYLMGNGVCNLASLMYWTAKEAGLDAYAPTNHNFADIPEIPREFSVSIYSMPGNPTANALQNMYITNSKDKPVVFEFEYNDKTLKFTIGIEQG